MQNVLSRRTQRQCRNYIHTHEEAVLIKGDANGNTYSARSFNEERVSVWKVKNGVKFACCGSCEFYPDFCKRCDDWVVFDWDEYYDEGFCSVCNF